MPMYDFRCTKCEFVVTDMPLKIDERDLPLELPCPSCEQTGGIERIPSAPGVSYSINRGGLKTPSGFKEILKDIKKRHRGSTINV